VGRGSRLLSSAGREIQYRAEGQGPGKRIVNIAGSLVWRLRMRVYLVVSRPDDAA
jgi:hypothetical protein